MAMTLDRAQERAEPINSWRRSALATLAVPLLAAPSAYGVYQYLEPESGALAAASAAVGFELLYLGVNVLVLPSAELRAYGRRVALAAVVTAVTFNALAHYAAKVPGAFSGAPFALLPALLALITALPLAGLAYAVSVLLHRISAGHAAHPAAQPAAHAGTAAASCDAAQDGLLRVAEPSSASTVLLVTHRCPRCESPISQQQAAAAIRWGTRWKGCPRCDLDRIADRSHAQER